MKKKLFSRGKIFPITLVGSLCALTVISSCGIYTVTGVLNPPFGKQTSTDSLIFHGYNTEDYFSGYIIWYKEAVTDSYYICLYKGEVELPTILNIDDMPAGWVEYTDLRSDTENPRIEYTVYIQDLKPLDSSNNFVELYDSNGQKFYFGVSSYGTEGQESEMIEFGIWPAF